VLRRAIQTTSGRLVLLLAAVALVVLGSAALAHFAFDEYGSYGNALWSAILHLLDPSSLHDDEGAAQRAIGLLQVIAGLTLLVGLLFTFVAEIVGDSLERLGQSDRPVHAREHLLIVSNPDLCGVAVRAVAEFNLRLPMFRRIVVLVAESQRESREQLRAELKRSAGGLKVDLVIGDTAGESGFELGAAEHATAILLMPVTAGPTTAEVADVEVTQTGLALHDYLEEHGADPLVRMLYRRGRNVDAAWRLLPSDWDAIVGDRVMAAVLRASITQARPAISVPGIPASPPSLLGEDGLVRRAWASAGREGRALRLAIVGCGFNAPALFEDLAQLGAERLDVTMLATRQAFETFLGEGQRSGIGVRFVETRLDDPTRLEVGLADADPDLILSTPAPNTTELRATDAEAMISLLRLLDIAGNAVPVVAELFLPDGIERLPRDPRLFAVSSLKTVAAAVTLSIFEPERAAALERQLSGGEPES
jgi:hypothetical protein